MTDSDPRAAAVGYMQRTREYYEAQGFERAYQWANYDDVPFTAPSRPLAESRLALITTTATFPRTHTDARSVDSGTIDPGPERLHAEDLSWDRGATHLDDLQSYFPLEGLREAVAAGRIGSLAPRFICAPTEYSIRRTTEQDAPEILDLCVAQQADVALLVPI